MRKDHQSTFIARSWLRGIENAQRFSTFEGHSFSLHIHQLQLVQSVQRNGLCLQGICGSGDAKIVPRSEISKREARMLIVASPKVGGT